MLQDPEELEYLSIEYLDLTRVLACHFSPLPHRCDQASHCGITLSTNTHTQALR